MPRLSPQPAGGAARLERDMPLFRSKDPEPSIVAADEYAEMQALRESVAAELDETPAPVFDPLPEYAHDALCPKCRFMPGTTQYHRGWHEHCAIPGSPPRLPLYWHGHPTREALMGEGRYMRVVAAVPEHFERACPNCKHAWAESAPVHAATA